MHSNMKLDQAPKENDLKRKALELVRNVAQKEQGWDGLDSVLSATVIKGGITNSLILVEGSLAEKVVVRFFGEI